jgi:hypothetical protein
MARYRIFLFFGDGGLVCLGTFAQVLKEIVEDKEVGGTKTWFRW